MFATLQVRINPYSNGIWIEQALFISNLRELLFLYF